MHGDWMMGLCGQYYRVIMAMMMMIMRVIIIIILIIVHNNVSDNLTFDETVKITPSGSPIPGDVKPTITSTATVSELRRVCNGYFLVRVTSSIK